MSEIEKIFKGLCKRFNKSNVNAERSYHFSLGEHEKWTVRITQEKCEVKKGEERRGRRLLQGPGRAVPRRVERPSTSSARRTSSPAR